MTAAERKVRAVFPCAGCERNVYEWAMGLGFRVREYGHRGDVLGSGATRAAAWKNAASRIPATPATGE
jgi:hypothetical protein